MEKDSITKSSIADTQLSERVKVALRAIGITDVADLMQTSMRELASRTTLGIQFLREIESFKRSIENRDSDAQKVQLPVKESRSLTKLEAANDIPVEDLELSARAYNALKLNRILTLGEFLHLDLDSLEHLDYVSHSIAEELYSCAREHLTERRLTRRQEDGETTDWDVKRDQPLSTATQEAMFPAVETTSSLVSDQVFSPSSAEVQEPHPFSAEAAQQIPAQEKPLLTSVQEQLLLPDEAQLQLVTGGKRPVPHAAVIDRIGEAEDKLLDATGDECVNRYSGVASSLADGAKKTEEPSRDEQDAQSNTLERIPSLKNDSRPIEMLSLSVRAYNCLKRAKINTVWELAALTHDELAKLRHLGSKTLAEIEDVLGHLIAEKNTEEDSKAESVVTPIRDLRPIETLGLSERSLFYLNMMEIKTIQALLDYPLDELWKYGPESETEIREAIQTYRSTAKGSPTRQFGENSSNSEHLSNGSPIEDIGLSVRSINCLRGAGIKTVQQLLATSAEKLLSIRNLGQKSLTEIETFKANYTPVFAATKVNDFSAGGEEDSSAGKSVLVIRDDRPIEDVGLSVRSYNCLRRAGIMTVQQLLDTSSEELLKIKNLGQKSLTELEEFRKSHVPTVALPPKTEYSVEELKPLVMDAFVTPFRGLSFEEIKAALPDTAEDSSIKRAVGELLCEHKIEYVDFRCYKVYPSFFTYFEKHLEDLPPRTRTVLVKRYAGETLEIIGKDLGITRERIRQIDKKAKAGYMRALRMACKKETGSTVFDEDFYRDLYTKCDLPESFWTEELGLSEGSIKYLKNTFKAGSKKPEETLNDEDIPVSLRYRVRNFLDRNKVRIDGRLMPRKRSDIEEYALRKYAKEEITFTDFSSLYNGLLEANGIPYDEKLYYTETSLRTRANRFSDSRLCLWKQGERLRYYDIDAGDYSELIETLGLDSYHDTEVSTRKFTNSFPELMKKYDIRDPYELHNLLKKISSRYKLDSVMFNRQPILQFGSFDRTKAITEAMFALAPVTQQDLVEYLYYLFRRNICEVPTNALNKIFLNLNREILRYDNTADNYVQKFIYALLSKKESGRFPDDEEFTNALGSKQVYQMRGKYKAYLFERFENFGTIETKDVYTHLDNNVYTIEHIMPQHLTPAWTEALGANAAEIHATWLHRLANLTLTGYNPNLSNKPFAEKRDSEEGGYKASGLKMNQKISNKESWGLPELEERNDEMIALAKKIWACPQTAFVPAEKEFDSCTLDDENAELTGRDIAKYSYQNVEQPVTSWADMFEHVVKFLHQKDKSVLSGLAYSTSTSTDLANYVSSIEAGLRSALKIDDHIFMERNSSTALKMSILRRLFSLYNADPMDLVFYLKDTESEKVAEAGRFEIRKRYWTYALPIIQKQHAHRGSFTNCSPTTSNTTSGFFGISGFQIICTANYDDAAVHFYMGKGDASKNKEAYDLLYIHRGEIEEQLGVSLNWDRADNCKASWIGYHLRDVSITNEADWPRMAKFHAEWSDKICNIILPYLQADDDTTTRLMSIAGILREWTVERDAVNENLAKCNRTYTRFTTSAMSEILMDIPDAPSGWNTDNHYFYEIVNRSGKSVFIQLAISSRNATEDFMVMCDRINDHYPSKIQKEDWQWRTPFKTSIVEIAGDISKEAIFVGLDKCLKEIQTFEADLKQKLEV